MLYMRLLVELAQPGATWVRLDEPALVEDRSADELAALRRAYRRLGAEWRTGRASQSRRTLVTWGRRWPSLGELPVEGVGLDFCRGKETSACSTRQEAGGTKVLFAGVVDGRNVWANDLDTSLTLLDRLGGLAGEVVVSTSCSLMHVPLGLARRGWDSTTRSAPGWPLPRRSSRNSPSWPGASTRGRAAVGEELATNQAALDARRRSTRVIDPVIRRRAASAADRSPAVLDRRRARRSCSRPAWDCHCLPTTTIGSFPQTAELRPTRASWRAGGLDEVDYRRSLQAETDRVIALQEEVGLDVLVHGEPERDDMVRYFAGQLLRVRAARGGMGPVLWLALRAAPRALRRCGPACPDNPRVGPLRPVAAPPGQ